MDFLEKLSFLERRLGGPSATAEAIGVSRHTLWRWKTGTRNPDRQSQMVVDFLMDQPAIIAHQDQTPLRGLSRGSWESVHKKLVVLEERFGGPVAASRAVGASYNTWWRWKTGSRHPSARFLQKIDGLINDGNSGQ